MKITTSELAGRRPAVLLALEGDLDGSTFEELIAEGRQLAAAGTRYALVDLTDLRFMSSAGLLALLTLTRLLRGQQEPNLADGWRAFASLNEDRDSGPQDHVYLLNPQDRVRRVLQATGLDAHIPVYNDRAEALAAMRGKETTA